MDIDRSRQERQLRRLAQKLAILEQELAATRRDSNGTSARSRSAQVIPLSSKSNDI
jgi:hypothetical protein